MPASTSTKTPNQDAMVSFEFKSASIFSSKLDSPWIVCAYHEYTSTELWDKKNSRTGSLSLWRSLYTTGREYLVWSVKQVVSHTYPSRSFNCNGCMSNNVHTTYPHHDLERTARQGKALDRTWCQSALHPGRTTRCKHRGCSKRPQDSLSHVW